VSEKKKESGEKVVAVNRQAGHIYHLLDRFEAGLVLQGTEVKSIREGRVNLKDSYAGIEQNELFLNQCHISPYTHGNRENHDPLRKRKLLLHRREIRRLIGKIAQRGFTLVPTRMYFRNGRVKVELALARGKKEHDRRAATREREQEREVRAALKERNR